MKALIVLSVILAVAASYPTVRTMTLSQLSTAIQRKENPALQPYFIMALNTIMENLYKGNDNFSQVIVPSPGGAATWTAKELEHERHVIQENIFSPTNEYSMVILRAFDLYSQRESLGVDEGGIKVTITAMDISTWTREDLDTALKSKTTEVGLIPYLQRAIDELESSGETNKDTISMVTTAGLIPQAPPIYVNKLKQE